MCLEKKVLFYNDRHISIARVNWEKCFVSSKRSKSNKAVFNCLPQVIFKGANKVSVILPAVKQLFYSYKNSGVKICRNCRQACELKCAHTAEKLEIILTTVSFSSRKELILFSSETTSLPAHLWFFVKMAKKIWDRRPLTVFFTRAHFVRNWICS